ncbi:DEAD/DEAH box helicase [Orrella marina]|nr:DEAD/DEAH box helicase [Orrella marina]
MTSAATLEHTALQARMPPPQRYLTPLQARIEQWFADRGHQPFGFQREVWQAMLKARSGLLHAGTGSGKTLACWLGALQVCERQEASIRTGKGARKQTERSAELKVLWITPMRALAQDSFRALQSSAADLCPDWTVQTRTGDTQASVRTRQAKAWPDALVTTPESLSLMLTQANAQTRLSRIAVVIVDEWHELVGSKRGVQVQLALARLTRWNPKLLVWGMSATLGNLEHALEALLPDAIASTNSTTDTAGRSCLISAPGFQTARTSRSTRATSSTGRTIDSNCSKTPIIDVMLPASLPRFAWSGQMGYAMAGVLAQRIRAATSSLVFVNTRAQTERWYQALLEADPSLAGLIALHHGSLDASVRQWVEQGIRNGSLKAVVCTSSLDLGVDFTAVEQVFQIGSCKGVARLLQRAGRSGHSPDGQPRIGLVPTHALEALEAVAAHDAVQAYAIEARQSPLAPMDVMVQHLVTVGLGGGFEPQALYDEIRQTWAYRHLDKQAWAWALAFVTTGGESLGAYPDYQRVVRGVRGVRDVPDVSDVPSSTQTGLQTLWRVTDRRLALRHRLNIGTIVSDAMMQIRFWTRKAGGAALGQIEEGFVARLKPGECFVFGGRVFELVRVQDMTVYVRRVQASRAAMPRWEGGSMPLSGELSQAMARRLAQYADLNREHQTDNHHTDVHADEPGTTEPEAERHIVCTPDQAWHALRPLLATQHEMTGLPSHERLLIEQMRSREGWHWFIYPMAGRRVHLALASLLAWRLAKKSPRTFSVSVNDYGLELLCNQPLDAQQHLTPDLFDESRLVSDLQASVNASELAQRRFREIARISGLVFQGFPGQKKSARQVQASSQLFYKVFEAYDPDNRLLHQAMQEVLTLEFDLPGLSSVLTRIRDQPFVATSTSKPTPFGFGLVVQRLSQRLSSEKLADRVTRMLREAGALQEVEQMPDHSGSSGPDSNGHRQSRSGPSGKRRRSMRTRKTPRTKTIDRVQD